MIFHVVKLSAVWNVGVPSWKYPKNLGTPRVSSPGFSNDSTMMVIAQHQTVYRRLRQIGLYARKAVRCLPFTATHCRLWLAWSRVWTLSTTVGLCVVFRRVQV
ncbi:transposable element Tcb1 transposase [Trichonephila clavipes]|nr:transposable element Tcb1 transposase [Trichonephila clavipes]